jgi:hypothetical protein
MGPDKPEVHDAIRVVDPNDNSILVAGNVEHHAAISRDTGGPDVALYSRRAWPVGGLYLPGPCRHRFARIGIGRASRDKALQSRRRDLSALYIVTYDVADDKVDPRVESLGKSFEAVTLAAVI